MKRKVRLLWMLIFLCLAGEEKAAAEEPQTKVEEMLMEEISLTQAQESLDALLGSSRFSLREAVLQLMKGELPLTAETVCSIGKEALLGEIGMYRKTAAYLLALIVASAVFTNFTAIFEKGQTAEISYYTVYLLMLALLLKAFSNMSQVASEAISSVLSFMELLLPACLVSLYFSSGSLTAMGFYQLTLWAAAGVQWLLNRFLLPGVQIYVILLFINQMMKEDYLSKLADLIKTGILWSLKTLTAVLLGMQAMQCVAAAGADRMKSSVVSRVVSAIPGIGNAYDTVTQTVLGSTVMLKNAVGITGVTALLLLGLLPVIKLACGTLIFRALGAAAQPVTDKRVSECIAGVAAGGELLLKLVLHAGTLFLISLAMITVMVRGG